MKRTYSAANSEAESYSRDASSLVVALDRSSPSEASTPLGGGQQQHQASPGAPSASNELDLSIDGDGFPFIEVKCPSCTVPVQQNSLESAFQKTLQAEAQKLAASMKRSQETRRSLVLCSPVVKKNPRMVSVDNVLDSVLKSTEKLKSCLPDDELSNGS